MNLAQAISVRLDRENSTYVTGGKRVNDFQHNVEHGSAIATVKYDSHGNEVWARQHQGGFGCFDHADAMAIDEAGNVYVTGTVWVNGYIIGDNGFPECPPKQPYCQTEYTTIKYSSSGVRQWLARYHAATGTDKPSAIAVDPQKGDVYVAGLSQDKDYSTDIATVKYDGRGKQIWAVRHHIPFGSKRVGAMVFDSTGSNLYVGGTDCNSVDPISQICTSTEYVVLKYDSTTGALKWTARYSKAPGLASDLAGMAVDHIGNIYVTGDSFNVPQSPGSQVFDADYATVKLNPEGGQLWVARYNNDGVSPHAFYGATAIALDDEGEVLVTGCGGLQDSGFHTVKYDQDGNRRWNAALEQNSYCPSGMAVDSHGVYVAGMALFSGAGYFYLVKYDSSGAEQWRDAVHGLEAGRDYSATAVAVDSEARVHATGGTLDVLGQALTSSSYLTRVYDSEGDPVWSREY